MSTEGGKANGTAKRPFWMLAFDDVEAGRVDTSAFDPNTKECWLALAGLTEPDMNKMTEMQRWQRLSKEYGGHLQRHLLALSEMGVPAEEIWKRAPMQPRKWDQWVAQATAHKNREEREAAEAAVSHMLVGVGGNGPSVAAVPGNPMTPENAMKKQKAIQEAADATAKGNAAAAEAADRARQDKLAAAVPAKHVASASADRTLRSTLVAGK